MASNNGGGGGGADERRRRIAERGSDRMALITGRINALPPTGPTTTSSHHPARHTQSMSATAIDSHSDDRDLPPRHVRPHSLSSTAFHVDYHEDQTGGAEDKRNASISSARLKHQGGFKHGKLDFEYKGEVEPLVEDSDYVKTEPSSVMSKDTNTQKPKKPRLRRHTFFSSRELNTSIIASENTRALSSLIIALLVVFCYMISESVLVSRPLYMVLLTDITIVFGRLYLEKATVMQETEGEQGEAQEDGHSWGDAVKLLERGLVAYQAIRGVFIDCSIYLVVVICGTCLM